MANLKVPVEPADHTLGDEHAPLTLVEYGDYECPHCGRAHAVVKALRKHFGKQLRFVYRHFPLTQIHPMAEPAAEAAEFAGANGHFWEMHDGIFGNQQNLSLPLLAELAQALGLSSEDLLSALESREFLPAVKEDFLGGRRNRGNTTPTLFINSDSYEGLNEFEDMVEAIDPKLFRGKTQHPPAG